MSDLKSPWSVHVDHQTSPGRFDVFSSEGHLVAVATSRELADLICAAPELLDLVQRANGKNGCHTVAWQEKAKEVLAKALGQ